MTRPSDPARPLCVLVVDDDPDATEAAATLLSIHGFRVLTAGSGAEALRVAAAEPPDVVLTELAMPGVHGLELARRLRAGGPRPLLLVAVTGCVSEADRREAEAAGFNLHLTKPVEPGVLVGVLSSFARALIPRPMPGAGRVTRPRRGSTAPARPPFPRPVPGPFPRPDPWLADLLPNQARRVRVLHENAAGVGASVLAFAARARAHARRVSDFCGRAAQQFVPFGCTGGCTYPR